METKFKRDGQRAPHIKWFYDLCEQIKRNDEQCFSVPVVTFRHPSKLSTPEKFQVCSLAFALLLSVGITADEFKTEFNKPSERETISFEYLLPGDISRASLGLLKCRLTEKGSEGTKENKKQVTRLVVELLTMFKIPISYFIEVQKSTQ